MIKTILAENAKDNRLTKLTLSNGEEVVGFILTLEPDDDCILMNVDGEGNGPWVAIAHIVTVQEWVID
jgi:hypothetical protein